MITISLIINYTLVPDIKIILFGIIDTKPEVQLWKYTRRYVDELLAAMEIGYGRYLTIYPDRYTPQQMHSRRSRIESHTKWY